MIFVDGNFAGSSVSDQFIGEPNPVYHGIDAIFAVADTLADRGPRVGNRLASGDSALAEVLDLLGPLKEIIRGPAATRVMMVPRLLEHIGALTGENDWPTFLQNQFCEAWALTSVTDSLVSVAWECLRNNQLDSDDVEDDPGLAALVAHVYDPRRGFYMAEVVARLNGAVPLFKVGSSRWIRLRDAAEGTATGTAATEWASRFQGQFKMLVSRLERCRHGLMHGWPVQPELVESVNEFACELAVLCIHLGLDGVLGQGNVADGFVAAKERTLRTRSLLQAATNAGLVGTALFAIGPPSGGA
jgi:hypothetical protein